MSDVEDKNEDGGTAVAAQKKEKEEGGGTAPSSSTPSSPSSSSGGEAAQTDTTGAEKSVIKKTLLQRSWTMWYDAPMKNKKADQATYHQNIKQIVSFRTVEDFWSLFNNLMPASNLKEKCNYHMFKEGIMPAWEDPQNAHGGKWVIELKTTEKQELDTIWLYTLLAMIGENFEAAEEICGCVVSIRAYRNRVAVWTKTASNDALQLQIGNEFKKAIDIRPGVKISFTSHADSQNFQQNQTPQHEL